MSYKEFDIDLDFKKTTYPESKADEDAVYISLDPDKSERKARIESKLTDQENQLFTAFLRANKNVFAWSAKDIPGIDPSIICHHLHLDPIGKPVIQRKRIHEIEQSKIIEAQIDKLNDTNFIIEVHPLHWLANVILVQNKKGKWRVFVDFTKLGPSAFKAPILLTVIQFFSSVIGLSKH